MQEKCIVYEFNKRNPLFSVRCDGDILSRFIPTKIIEQYAIECNCVSDFMNAFKTREDAQRFADMINDMNELIEKLVTQYYSNEDFQQKIDEVILPYLMMDKLVE